MTRENNIEAGRDHPDAPRTATPADERPLILWFFDARDVLGKLSGLNDSPATRDPSDGKSNKHGISSPQQAMAWAAHQELGRWIKLVAANFAIAHMVVPRDISEPTPDEVGMKALAEMIRVAAISSDYEWSSAAPAMTALACLWNSLISTPTVTKKP